MKGKNIVDVKKTEHIALVLCMLHHLQYRHLVNSSNVTDRQVAYAGVCMNTGKCCVIHVWWKRYVTSRICVVVVLYVLCGDW